MSIPEMKSLLNSHHGYDGRRATRKEHQNGIARTEDIDDDDCAQGTFGPF
jgi:hypothetical protein